jgi:hypothetical protein
MKTVGKIGNEPTILDTNAASGNFQFSYSLNTFNNRSFENQCQR